MDYVDEAQKLPRRLLGQLKSTFQGFSEHDGLSMAAATAYYFALSLFPLMLVLVAGLGVVLKSTATGQDARKELLTIIEQQASPELSQQIGKALQVVSEQASASGPIGFLALVVTSIAIFSQFDHAFNQIWTVKSNNSHGWLQVVWKLVFRRLKALVMLLAAGAFVFLGTVASLIWSGVQTHLSPAFDMLPEARSGLSILLNIALNFLAFTLIYRFVPAARIRWADALRGACLAAILWEVGRQLLEIYLIHRGYSSAYGVIGSFMAIMLWAYYAMIVVLVGAEFTHVVGEEAKQAIDAEKA